MSADAPDAGPVSQKVVNRLRRQVLTRQLMEGVELPSVRRLADMEGIGVVTANRVLKRIESEGWAERYVGRRLRIAKNALTLARENLKHAPPPTITLVTPSHARLGMESDMVVVSESYREVFPGCSVRQAFVDVSRGVDDLRELLQQDARMSCEVGYILSAMPRAFKEVFHLGNVPCVVAGYVEPDLQLPCVYEDMRIIGRLAGERLLPSRRLVALCSRELIGAEVYLYDGVSDAARVLDCPVPKPGEFYQHMPQSVEDVVATIDRLLADDDRPDAILAVRPEYAWVAVQIAARRRIRTPDQLQLIGLHHHPMYRFTYPQITSIGPSSLAILGRRCAQLLAEAMGQRHSEPPREVIESTLVDRESTRPIANGAREYTPDAGRGESA